MIGLNSVSAGVPNIMSHTYLAPCHAHAHDTVAKRARLYRKHKSVRGCHEHMLSRASGCHAHRPSCVRVTVAIEHSLSRHNPHIVHVSAG